MKILKVNKIELPKLRVGFILLWKTRVQAGATLFIEKGSKWSKNELFSLIVYMKFGRPSRPSSYRAVYYSRSLHSINLFPLTKMCQFWLTACAQWKACFFRSFIDTLWLFLVRNSYSTRACWIWDYYSQLLWVRVKDKLPNSSGLKKMVSLLLMVIAFSRGITMNRWKHHCLESKF